ncbi:MAG: peptide chain release factor 2 [candidate division Zixibacteria bacterium 4484_93]|nr:MAG: peptide chain release factor 2 [candidate division Zixibacteria bacterium 4484_93]
MNSGGIFDIDETRSELARLDEVISSPDFWNEDEKKRRDVISRRKQLSDIIESFDAVEKQFADISELAGVLTDPKDIKELTVDIESLSARLDELQLKFVLSGENDPGNAILVIHSGAGGTEACDWSEMLLRMYLRWCEKKGFKTTIIDILSGEEAGIKSATVEVRGRYAYGLLKAEIGIHRLVRISPFDSNRRRHTSFASVFVYPEVDEDVKIEINPDDLRIDVYHSSGHGGQNVNKVETAIRITHIPTGIVVQCQAERSQYKNREIAMRLLRSRLYERQLEEERKRKAELEKTKKKIEWGSQIRSYVLHPYNMVKDHRTGIETGNTQAVLDGELDMFIEGYLLGKNE